MKITKYLLTFAVCVAAIPTCVLMLDGFKSVSFFTSIIVGMLVGAVHIVVRPVLKLISKPLGCLTLGLIQPAIDLGILYLCAGMVDGFAIKNILHGLLAVVMINAACFIVTLGK